MNRNKPTKRGVWTYWTHVLCYACHGNDFDGKTYDEETWNELLQPIPLREGYGVTDCDKCGCDIQVDDSVAEEHNLVGELREVGIDAHMWQTGGMNSAVGIPMERQKEDEEGYYYMVTYNQEGMGEYMVGVYEEYGEYEEEKSFVTTDKKEFLAKLMERKDELAQIEK